MSEPADTFDPASALGPDAVAPQPAAPPAPKPRVVRRNGDVLGIGWLNGSFTLAVFRGKSTVGSWNFDTPVRTVEEFEPALDQGLAAVNFAGTDVFLVLEHDQFSHQTEAAPGFSDAAARAYLKGKVDRFEKDREPVLWVAQPIHSVKQDRCFLLHLLPQAFYDNLSRVLLARRLDLTRILPIALPLHRELNRLPINKDALVLIAAEAGEATTVIVGRAGGPLLFARSVLASMTNDPARIGVEVNRSLLYVKQQFGVPVDRLWLFGRGNHATAEVRAKCGPGKQITVLPSEPLDWLQSANRLPEHQPINLLAGYLRRKRRQQLVRRSLCAACWLGLGLFSFNVWNQTAQWNLEQVQLAKLRASESTQRAERDRLVARNQEMDRDRAFIRLVSDDRLPPVPGRLVALIASLLPNEARLTDFNVKWESANNAWTFRIEGVIEGDEEFGRESILSLQKQLAKSPLHPHFNESARAVVAIALPAANGSGPATDTQRFSLEGSLEN